jgi:hypothetical protein
MVGQPEKMLCSLSENCTASWIPKFQIARSICA